MTRVPRLLRVQIPRAPSGTIESRDAPGGSSEGRPSDAVRRVFPDDLEEGWGVAAVFALTAGPEPFSSFILSAEDRTVVG